MNIQKFTQKSVEAINNCQQLAYEYGNQQIEQEHLLYALLTLEDSLIRRLIEKMGGLCQQRPEQSPAGRGAGSQVSGRRLCLCRASFPGPDQACHGRRQKGLPGICH